MVIACAVSGTGQAQVLYGSIVGNVTDPNGAAVPGAAVKITQIATNETREAATNEVGLYTLAAVPAGAYNVSITKARLRDFVAHDIEVRINTSVRLDAQLTLSTKTETIEVTAPAAVLQTDRADVHQDVTSHELVNLPQPTRTYQGLLAVVPGVNPPAAQSGGTNDPIRSMVLEANGTSQTGTDVRIEGVSAVNPWVQFFSTTVPSIEAIETVNVVTGASQADQTLVGGASVNVQMKSGTNQFQGSAYEYHQDNAIKTRPFFLPADQRKPKNINNDLGGTFGGPIVRNRLFFFASYEGEFTRSVAGQFGGVPTAAMLSGDFSQTGATIYDPNTGNPDGSGKQPFQGNKIPPNQISPIVRKLLPLVPAPNTGQFGANANNFYGNLPTRYTTSRKSTLKSISTPRRGCGSPAASTMTRTLKPRFRSSGPSWGRAATPVTQARFGTAGFDPLRGAGTVNLDSSLFRKFRVTERWSLQFRAECFNVTNTPHFSNPGANVSSMQLNSDGSIKNLNGYTQITGVSAPSRLVDERYFRFGLKLLF